MNAINIGYVTPSSSPELQPDALLDLRDKTIILRLLASRDFLAGDFTKVKSNSSAEASDLLIGKPASADIGIAVPGDYEISVAGSGRMLLMVDGHESNGTAYLSQGLHLIDVVPLNDTCLLRHVTFIRLPDAPVSDDGWKPQAKVLAWNKTGPSSYAARVQSSGPFILILSRARDAQWKLEADGVSYSPVASFDAVNAYHLNLTGINDIRMEYAPQRYAAYGAIIGLLGMSAALAIAWRSK
jgi:hypothetical protein